jgi:hypothetical protein
MKAGQSMISAGQYTRDSLAGPKAGGACRDVGARSGGQFDIDTLVRLVAIRLCAI